MGSCMWFTLWCSCVLCCTWSQTACAETTKQHTPLDSFSRGDTYRSGPHKVNITVVPSCDTGSSASRSCCDKNLVITAPKENGSYPVVQFQHGFRLSDHSVYGTVFHHIASWGFIVVAPQMYGIHDPEKNATQEINDARAILKWMSTGLAPVLLPWTPAMPDVEKIALVGHSRGGKVVYGVALNVTNSTITIPKILAVVGLDPVDGTGDGPDDQIKPPVLTHKNDSLNLGEGVQTLIVGTGLGPESDCPRFLPPCAPKNYSHIYFFDDVAPPAFHFIATKQGHMDFCDCVHIPLSCLVCKNNALTRPQMHRFAAGIVAAFLQKTLLDDSTAFDAAYALSTKPPVELATPDRKPRQIPDHAESHQHARV